MKLKCCAEIAGVDTDASDNGNLLIVINA